ncbi:MAG: carboxypeptidase-like regulatory domain-containing protein [Prevotella sp.]|nr:carboxypeptidase-like regulatory domain-containing protein [Prevotella sp.]
MKHLFLGIFFLLVPSFMWGQSFHGAVVDSLGHPLPNTSVLLYAEQYVDGTLTGDDGVFILHCPDSLLGRRLTLRISGLGYDERKLIAETEMGKIALHQNATTLGEVVVKGSRQPVKVRNGKIEVDVQHSVLSRLGSLSEILGHVPFVERTEDAFTVAGRGTPVIYVDNRQIRDTKELVNIISKEVKSRACDNVSWPTIRDRCESRNPYYD